MFLCVLITLAIGGNAKTSHHSRNPSQCWRPYSYQKRHQVSIIELCAQSVEK